MNRSKGLFLLLAVMLFCGGQLLADGCCGSSCCSSSCCSSSCCDSCCNSCCSDCCSICEGGYYTSRSYFHPIEMYQSGTWLHEVLFGSEWMSMREDGCGSAFQIVPFGGKTTDKATCGLGKWFGLNYKSCLSVIESVEDADYASRDLDPRHFNLQTVDGDFKSTICICPKQKFFGLGLSWKQALCRDEDTDAVKYWMELTAPILHVDNTMCLTESVTTDGGGAYTAHTGLDDADRVATMVAAFKQTTWKYGKIDNCCDMDKTRLADLEIKVGTYTNVGTCCNLNGYIGLVAPTGNENCATYVFSPVVGNGNHWGIMWGGELYFQAYEWDCGDLMFSINWDSRYLFKEDQYRSFDLVGKQWGRYMEMYATQEAAAAADTDNDIYAGTSGINLMTRCVEVKPGWQFNMNTSVIFEGCNWNAEVGHTIYNRQGEEICPCWTEGPVLKALGGDGAMTRARTISKTFTGCDDAYSADNYTQDKITTCDIDWNSGAMPAVIAHTIYGALGYVWDDVCYPTTLSVGAGYDFAHGNSALHRWTVFGKLGFSF